jgi:hypothetical protein
LAGEDDLDGPPLEANDNRPTENHGDGRIAEAAAKKFKPQHSAAEAVQENSVGAAKERVSLPDVETPSVVAGRKREPPRAKRRSPRRPAAAPVSARSSDPCDDLAEIHDADALLHWAAVNMPERNKLDAAARVMCDASFLAKADAIGVEPELLIPFDYQREAGQTSNGPASSA